LNPFSISGIPSLKAVQNIPITGKIYHSIQIFAGDLKFCFLVHSRIYSLCRKKILPIFAPNCSSSACRGSPSISRRRARSGSAGTSLRIGQARVGHGQPLLDQQHVGWIGIEIDLPMAFKKKLQCGKPNHKPSNLAFRDDGYHPVAEIWSMVYY